MPSETLKSLSDIDIETLFDYLNFLIQKQEGKTDIPEWFKPHLEKMKEEEEQRKNG